MPNVPCAPGLELVTAAAALKSRSGTDLQCRVRIATGLVVVGDLVGRGEAQERGIVGVTPNLAARLQALAGPGDVVIAQLTARSAMLRTERSRKAPTR
jgi:class 3 adenylate cyclase